MQLKASTDYGMRAILYLAAKNRTCSSKDIASDMAIPRDYLIQLAQQLRNASLIEAHPGKHGGYCLAKDPSEISVLDVMIAIDEDAKQIARLKRNARSGGEMAAEIRQTYDLVEQSMDAFLASITIELLVNCTNNTASIKKFLAARFQDESLRLVEEAEAEELMKQA